MSDIAGKVVTRESSGIDAATALLLAERGAKLVLGARGLDCLQALAARISAAGGDSAFARTAVRQRGDVSGLVDLALGHYGKLDVLLANAGIGPISALDELRVEAWDAMIDIKIKGVRYGIAAARPVFRRHGSGDIIASGSTMGDKTVAKQSVYFATKFAVRAICEGLRQEAGDKLRGRSFCQVSCGRTSSKQWRMRP